jgi:hypothetical protein
MKQIDHIYHEHKNYHDKKEFQSTQILGQFVKRKNLNLSPIKKQNIQKYIYKACPKKKKDFFYSNNV